MAFELIDAQPQGAVIKVVGVGGCGGNAIDHMIEQGVQGVEFIVINTDAQALKRSKAKVQLQIGATLTRAWVRVPSPRSAKPPPRKIVGASPT